MILTCAEVRDLAPAFVLGALDDTEAAAVREHLAACSDLHEEFATLGGVAGYLAESVEPVEPPVGLKGKILAAAAADLMAVAEVPAPAGVLPATGGRAAGVPDVAEAMRPVLAAPSAAPPALRFRFDDGRRRQGSTSSWAMRLAAVLAIVVLGGWSLILQGRLDASERYAQAVAAVVAAAAQPGSQTAIMSGAAAGPTGIAAVGADGSIVLAMRDLAPTAGAEVYEAWVIVGDGGPVPVGSFTVAADGTGTFTASGTAAVVGSTLALTREPGPGATTPTLPIVSSGVAVAPPG